MAAGPVTGVARGDEPRRLITHRFALDDIIAAYEVVGNAAKEKALKVVMSA